MGRAEPLREPSDVFFGSSRPRRVGTSAGGCELPILYRDASLLGLVYRVEPTRARLLLDSPAVEPWVTFGKATVLICAFECRDTTLGAYAEVGLAVLARRTGTHPSVIRLIRDVRDATDAAWFVVNLPVTAEAVRAAGVEIWGYPKYVTPIETRFERDHVRVSIPSEFELTTRKGYGFDTRAMALPTYSVASGRLLRTIADVDHRLSWALAGNTRLDVHGRGPIATSLGILGLAGSDPVVVFRTDRMRSILPFGTDLGAVTAHA